MHCFLCIKVDPNGSGALKHAKQQLSSEDRRHYICIPSRLQACCAGQMISMFPAEGRQMCFQSNSFSSALKKVLLLVMSDVIQVLTLQKPSALSTLAPAADGPGPMPIAGVATAPTTKPAAADAALPAKLAATDVNGIAPTNVDTAEHAEDEVSRWRARVAVFIQMLVLLMCDMRLVIVARAATC